MNIGEFLRRNGCAIVIIGGLFVLGGSILYPFFASARYYARCSSCLSNLKAVAVACQQYRADYDGRFPPLSDGGSRGWSVLIQKGNKPLDFSCAEGTGSSFSPTSDYFFNARLATRRSSTIWDTTYTIAFGDGVDNGPSNSHYWELPNDHENENSPLQRHCGRANYAFVDGHVKSLTPKGLSEWWEDDGDHKEWHYKFSPDESASRVIPRKEVASPTAKAQTKRLPDLVRAARSFEKRN